VTIQELGTFRPAAADDRLARRRALDARVNADHATALCARAGLAPRRIAEIGCGDGALLTEIGARGLAGEVYGFETSPEAAHAARTRGGPGLARVDLWDGRRVPAGDRAFDVALVSGALEWATSPEALLREAARVADYVVIESDTPAPTRAAVAAAGLKVVCELLDPLPLEVHTFGVPRGSGHARAVLRAGVRRGLFTLSPRLAQRAFPLRYACLCR
jgi:SAM-dependent methyltransferase